MKCLLDGPSSLKTIHAKQYSTVQTLGTRWVQCSHFGEAEVVNPDSDTDGLHSIIVQLSMVTLHEKLYQRFLCCELGVLC